MSDFQKKKRHPSFSQRQLSNTLISKLREISAGRKCLLFLSLIPLREHGTDPVNASLLIPWFHLVYCTETPFYTPFPFITLSVLTVLEKASREETLNVCYYMWHIEAFWHSCNKYIPIG